MEMRSNGTPIKPNSKNENPVRPFWAKALLTIILGGVPVRVNNPPRQSLIVWAIAEGRSAAAGADSYLMSQSRLPVPIKPGDRPLM